jgi:hypothetical protein
VSDVARLLDDVTAFVRRYVVLSPAELVAVALWTFHTHAIDAAPATPYLSITSAEKESGKTRLLEVLELLVARPWLTGRVTAAVLARKIDKERPTLLLDESDAAFGGEKEYAEVLRGILNSGHRVGGRSSLCVGQGASITYADLSTFCAKAIAGIGELPDTVASRSVPIRLKRKAPDETVERFRHRDAATAAEPVQVSLASLAEHHVPQLVAARPELPETLGDRAADSWEPLFAIADLAGGEWPARARDAAVELSARARSDDESRGPLLLADIWNVFEARPEARHLATKVLIEGLCENEEAPWATWHKGAPISPRALGRLLKAFDIHSKSVRLPDQSTPKGYSREDFEDAWRRFLPSHTPDLSATTPQPASVLEKPADSIRHTTPLVADTKTASNPHGQRDVADVADRNGGRAPQPFRWSENEEERKRQRDALARARLELQDAKREQELERLRAELKHEEQLDLGTASLDTIRERYA